MESRGKRPVRLAGPIGEPTFQVPPAAEPKISVERLPEARSAEPETAAADVAPSPAPLSGASSPIASEAAGGNAIAASRAAIEQGYRALSEELASFAGRAAETAAHTAIDLLAVRTWSDAIAVNRNFARASFDHWLDSSARISDIGVKLAVAAANPFLLVYGRC